MAGIFDLLSAADLCAKLEHDYARVTKSPSDVYAAFDFVITAWHLLEWRFHGEDGRKTRERLREEHPILEVCEHLAVGGKHFEPTAKRHRTVKASRRSAVWKRGVWAPRVWAPGLWADDLVIELAGPAKEAFGDKLPFPRFASLVMEFWRGTGGCLGHRASGTSP